MKTLSTVITIVAPLLLLAGCSPTAGIHFENRTGHDVVISSTDMQDQVKTYEVSKDSSRFFHLVQLKALIIKTDSGNEWSYRNLESLSPMIHPCTERKEGGIRNGPPSDILRVAIGPDGTLSPLRCDDHNESQKALEPKSGDR